MNRFALSTPEGMRDRLYEDCQDRLRVDRILESFFAGRGYRRVLTPALEFYDVFQQSGSILPQEEMMKLVDSSGRLLVLRPDVTTPIARIAATRLGAEVFPQRLSYLAPVFRLDRENMGHSFEIAQAGIELLGAGGTLADLEVVTLAVDALFACGFSEFYFGLGHVGVVRALLEDLGLEDAQRETLCRLMAEENYPALDQALAPYAGRPACEALRKLPLLFGGEEVFAQAEALLSCVPGALAPLRSLNSLFQNLKAAGYGDKIQLDLGLMNQVDYYTGILFHGMVPGAGAAVLTGGRYDELIGAYGRPMPAAGFALNTDAVAQSLPGAGREKTVTLIHFTPATLPAALQALQAGGRELSPCDTEEGTLALAREKSAKTVLFCRETGVEEVEVRP